MSARLANFPSGAPSGAAAARSFLLTNWVTIRGSSSVLSVTQDAEEWLELPGFAEATFYVDVAEVTAPSGASAGLVLLYLETAPTADESLFQTVAGPIVCAPSSTPIVAKTASAGATPLCRYVRWRAVATLAATWDVTVRVRAVANRASYFAPTQLGGCALWLRADIGLTFNVAKVSQWSDQSGNRNHAVQATTTRQPGYNVNLVNGQSTLNFDPSSAGSEKIMSLSSSLASLTASHAFVVHQRATATEGTPSATGFWALGTSGSDTHMPWSGDQHIYDDGGGTVRYNEGTPVVTLTTPQAYEVRNQAGSWASFANGTAQFSSGTNTVGLTASPQIGGWTTGGVYYRGEWAEMILFNRILATSERALVIKYLNNRYALGAT